MFDAAVARAMPDKCVPPFLPKPPQGPHDRGGRGQGRGHHGQGGGGPLAGRADRAGGHALRASRACQRIEVVEAAHPVPDAPGSEAAERILQMVQGLPAG